MTAVPLVPALTLARVFGPGVVYVPRRSPNLPGWSPPAPGQIDFVTGLQLGLAGGMPYVASTATVTPRVRALLAEAGLPVNAKLHTYSGTGDYLPLLDRLRGQGYRLAIQRVHPVSEVPAHATIPSPGLLSELNDKATLDALVPHGLAPARRTIAVRELPGASALLGNGRPVVLKASTFRPCGGGHGVWICHTEAHIEAARQRLAGEERVVVEEFLPIDASICVHGVVYPDGRCEIVGSAEEIVSDGRWRGNWHDARGDMVPDEVLAQVRAIMRNGADRGYRGIIGIDVARLENGTWRVLDLNFRVNGSTAGAWLRASITTSRGVPVMQGRGWSCPAGFDRLFDVVAEAVRRGTFVPLGLYDPDAGSTGGLARVAGLLLGESREAIEEENRRLTSEGLA